MRLPVVSYAESAGSVLKSERIAVRVYLSFFFLLSRAVNFLEGHAMLRSRGKEMCSPFWFWILIWLHVSLIRHTAHASALLTVCRLRHSQLIHWCR